MTIQFDMNKQPYYYHIITTANIEEELKHLQVYPVVHYHEESCETKCERSSCSKAKIDDGRGDGGRATDPFTESDGGPIDLTTNTNGANGTGRDWDTGLSEVSEGTTRSLCAGIEGSQQPESGGGLRVSWRNGRRRRYSKGTGSCERIQHDDSGLGQGVGIGTYLPGPEGEIPTVYDGPYKLVAVHTGTRRRHWHLIYISYNRQWGFNSRLGRAIRSSAYKTTSINCVSCLRQYLYTGAGRQVLQDILCEELTAACQCASHTLGMDGDNKGTQENYEITSSEGGDAILYNEGEPSTEEYEGVVDATSQACQRELRKRLRDGDQIQPEASKILCRGKTNEHGGDLESRKDWQFYNRNSNIILLLCDSGAFSEATAMEVLTGTPEGIEFILSKQYAEKIKNYVHIARILVFQESMKQRFERAKVKFLKESPECTSQEYSDNTMRSFENLLKCNNINLENFFKMTFYHMHGKMGKRNNLFFFGPPSTGKTMVMNALVECQFNFCRLTGLTPNSSFNFSGLLHCNACYMDECKLTENQFEQWKLLASGMPMSTDVKYKDRCDVNACVVYTCSNYPIEMYCKVPMAKKAVAERTIEFHFNTIIKEHFKISPHVWETLWEKYGLVL